MRQDEMERLSKMTKKSLKERVTKAKRDMYLVRLMATDTEVSMIAGLFEKALQDALEKEGWK